MLNLLQLVLALELNALLPKLCLCRFGFFHHCAWSLAASTVYLRDNVIHMS